MTCVFVRVFCCFRREKHWRRHRIGLARALYSTAPVLLIDDTLSALDGPVAAAAWRLGVGVGTPDAPSLLDVEHRARVVVTNNAALLGDAGVVVVSCIPLLMVVRGIVP